MILWTEMVSWLMERLLDCVEKTWKWIRGVKDDAPDEKKDA